MLLLVGRSRVWLFGFSLLFLLFFLRVQVAAKCDQRDASVVKYSNCTAGYNCSNMLDSYPVNDYQSGINSCFNDHPGSCAEAMISMGETSMMYIVKCYAKFGEPTPTTPPPNTCGTANRSCCTSYPYCQDGLYPHNTGGSTCVCRGSPETEPTPVPDSTLDPFCGDGYSANSSDPRIKSAIGCIPVTLNAFVIWLLPILFGILGGVSFLLLVFGFIKIATSQGDPKAVQGGRETINSAIIGLIVAIFSLFILRLILVGILNIPGIN